MYNKLFQKILDSSVWLESNETRIVWITLLAAMDEEGYAPFASTANLAHRARINPDQAALAVARLEAPDEVAPDQDHEGRRIERVPGGWMVLNAKAYRDTVTREEAKRVVRERVARHRAKKKGNACNANVIFGNASVTQSDTDTDTAPSSPSASGEQGGGMLTQNGNAMVLPQTPPGDRFEVPESLRVPAFLAEWDKWLEIKNPRGSQARSKRVMFAEQLLFLAKLGTPRAAETVNYSIRQGYRGLVEPKSETKKVKRVNPLEI